MARAKLKAIGGRYQKIKCVLRFRFRDSDSFAVCVQGDSSEPKINPEPF